MTPYYEDGGVAIYHGDSLDVLPQLREPFDLVVADPPYSVGLSSFGERTNASGWGDIMNGAHFHASWLSLCRERIQNQAGALWAFNSWRSFPILARASFLVEWQITSVLIWDKVGIGPGGVIGLRPRYEVIALFAGPGFAVADRGLSDVWACGPAPRSQHGGHAAEKPVGLVARLTRESGGTRVLDPFMGTGTTLRAAKDLGRQAIGIEIEERYCEMAAQRLSQEVLGFGT